MAGADAMRGKRPIFGGPWIASARAYCDWNSPAWSGRTVSCSMGHSASRMGHHHYWINFLCLWPLGNGETRWGGLSLKTLAQPWSLGSQKPRSCQDDQRKIAKKTQFNQAGRWSFSNMGGSRCITISILSIEGECYSQQMIPRKARWSKGHYRKILLQKTAFNLRSNAVKMHWIMPKTRAAWPIQRWCWRNLLGGSIIAKRSKSKTKLLFETVNKIPSTIPPPIKEGREEA